MTVMEGTIGPHATRLLIPDLRSAVDRGRVFAVANQAGITTQAGLSLTTPALTLANPLGSGVKGRLWFAGVTFTVVFATVGAIWLAVGTSPVAAAVTGTLTTAHRNLKLGGLDQQGNKIIPYLAATLPAAPVGISLLGSGLTGAVNLLPHIQALGRWYYGSIKIMPGTNVSIQTGVASGATGTFCEYIWEEEDE